MSELDLCDLIAMVAIVQATLCILCLQYEKYQQILDDVDNSIRRIDCNYNPRIVNRKKLSEIIDPIADT